MIRPALLAMCLAMTATVAAAEPLPVERVFAAPALNGPAPRGVQISPDGALVTYLKPEPTDQTTFDLWARPVRGGAERRLIEGAAVEPKDAHLTEAEKSRRERQRIAGDHGVVDYTWDETGEQILVPAAGKLYLANAKTGAVRRLGGDVFIDVNTKPPRSPVDLERAVAASPSTEIADATDAKISPKGGYVTYVRDQNLHALDLKTGRDVALTTEGKDTLSFGVAEFVAQEEMDRYTGYWTSPDDRLIAFTRVDESPVDVVPRFDIGAEGVTVVNQRYPRAGRPNAVVELYVAPIGGGARMKVDLGPDADIYLARVAWSKDAKTLYVQRETRDQQTLDLLAVDPATGAAKVILTEHRKPWINLNDDFTPLKNGDFIWGSERTGFHHLYLYRRDGTLVRQITHGAWPVAQSGGAGAHASAVAGVDETAGVVYFIASVESPLVRNLYAVSYLDPREPKKITGGDGWWGVDLAKDNKSYVGTYTDPKTPAQTALYAIAGERLAWIEENALKPGHPYYPYLDHKTYPEFGTLKAEDGQTLYYALTKPYGFDPAKKYPAIISVYGGPGALPMVGKRWAGGTDQLLTQAGFVVFRLDNRGTSNRGLSFESPIYKAMGHPEVKDQLVGRAYLAALPFVDPKRIGVMGWSYGGFMTIRLLTEPGSGLAAGAGGGPPSDWRFYDTHYTERYMGDPRIDGAAYDASALLPRLPELAKPGAPRLLLLHGMADDNVVFENSTRIMAKLQAEDVPFDLMLYPGERHGVHEPKKQAQLWQTYLAFFKRTLGGPQ
jgi:dipeptidyl-peptidase-4